MTIEEAFKAGWAAGYYDGGEHDCRMFEPSANRAWEDFVFRNKSKLGTKRCSRCNKPEKHCWCR